MPANWQPPATPRVGRRGELRPPCASPLSFASTGSFSSLLSLSPSSRSRRARREQSSLPVPLRPSSAAPPPFHAPRAAQEVIRPVLNIHCPVQSSISPSLGRNRARRCRTPLTLARDSDPLTDDQPPLLLDSIQGSGGIPLALLDLPDPFPLWFVRHRRRERLSPPCAAACSPHPF